MDVKQFQVTLVVAISWDQHSVGHKMKNFYLMGWVIFSCRGSGCFSCCKLLYKQFCFQLFLKFQFVCLDFETDSGIDTRIFNLFSEGCGSCRNIFLVFNDFWWKLFVVYFRNLVSFERSTSSFSTFLNYLCCLPNIPCCLSNISSHRENISSDLANMAYILFSKKLLTQRAVVM